MWHATLSSLLALVCVMTSPEAGETGEDELVATLSRHVESLTSEDLGGRGEDTQGHLLARDYIASQMEAIGLEPAGGQGWFDPVEAVVDTQMVRGVSLTVGESLLTPRAEFVPLGCSGGAEFSGEAIFVGWGVSAPSVGWDAYAMADVRDKVVVALTGAPQALEERLGPHDLFMTQDHAKAATALAHGARAIILIHDPLVYDGANHSAPDRLDPPSIVWPLRGFPAGKVSAKVGRRLFSSLGYDLEEVVNARTRGAGASLSLGMTRGNFDVEHRIETLYNVMGKLEGDRAEIVLGAHYDGLGLGWMGSREGGAPAFHPGADDNASGVALMLEVARLLRAASPESGKTLTFVAFAGEELGLWGSRAFASRRGEEITAAVTLDMVGRPRQEKLFAIGASRQQWREARPLAERQQIMLQDAPVDSAHSDHIALMERGIETLHLTTGRHGDYHTTRDTKEKLDYTWLARLTLFVSSLLSHTSGEKSGPGSLPL